MRNYVILKRLLSEEEITYKDVARTLQIHPNSVGNKVRGTQPFTIGEAIKLRDELFPYMDIEELFKEDDK